MKRKPRQLVQSADFIFFPSCGADISKQSRNLCVLFMVLAICMLIGMRNDEKNYAINYLSTASVREQMHWMKTLLRENRVRSVFFFPKILSKQSKHTTTTSERNRCNIERHLLINGKRMSRERRKLLFKIWIFYTVSNSIQSIERRLHDIIFKCKS